VRGRIVDTTLVIGPGTGDARLVGGRYRIIAPLARGGMSEVVEALDERLHRRVALKLLAPSIAEDAAAATRFEREARAVAGLSHPGIVTIYDHGTDGVPFIVMELIEGPTLKGMIEQRAPFPEAEAAAIVLQVLDALDHAHGRGIVHRDIKPQNIMLAPRGQVKVLDFGIAADQGGPRGAEEETATQLTAPGMVLGTWPYMSPEQVRGESLDGRSDLFSLGVVLFETVWGFHPFKAQSAAEVASKILTHDPLPLDGPDAARSPALAPIVRRCLEKDRARRFPTGGDLIADLEGGRSGATIGISPRPRRRAFAVGIFLLLVVVAAGAAVAVRWGVRRSDAGHTAYDDYVRGKVKMRLVNRESLDAAVQLFEAAVSADARFAPAQAELARAYIYKAFQFSTGDEQTRLFEDADIAIQKALALNPNLAEAHLARGLLVWTKARGFPHEMAIRAYRRAIELDPNLDEAHLELGVVCMHVGMLDEAQNEIQRALTLNPDNTLARTRTGTIALYGGDYAKAIEILQGVPEETSPSYRSRALADALFRAGRNQEAAELVDAYLKRYPADEGGSLTSVKALLLAHTGNRDEAEAAIRRASEIGQMAGHFHHTAYNIGCAYSMLGRRDLALHWLRLAAGEGFPCYPFYEVDWTLNAIRTDPTFKAFLAEMKKQREGFEKLK